MASFVSILALLAAVGAQEFGSPLSSNLPSFTSFGSDNVTAIDSASLTFEIPAAAVLRELTARADYCPLGESVCPDAQHCVPPGKFCCPENNSKGCPVGTTCCYGSPQGHCTVPGGFCCGRTSCEAGEVCCDGRFCAPEGSTCCGDNRYCDSTQVCVPGRGCLAKGSSSCGPYVCKANEKCCGGDDGCAPLDGTCCGPDYYCKAGNKCCMDEWNSTFCAPECYDTFQLDFDDYGEEMREIFENMCRGIFRSGSSSAQEMFLEYDRNRSNARRRRRASGCAGAKRMQCAKVFSDSTIRWQCDEFPFASTVQGGANAAAMCAPGVDNGRIGGKWGNKIQRTKATSGTIFRFKIKNFDCSKINDDSFKRDATLTPSLIEGLAERANGNVIRNDSTGIFVDAKEFGEGLADGRIAMIIPLEIPADFIGIFEMEYKLESGTLRSGRIIDDDGFDYGEIKVTSSGTGATASIEVDEDGVGNVMIIGWADNAEVTIEITTSLKPTASTSSTSPVSSIASKTTSVPAISITNKSPAVRLRGPAGSVLVTLLSYWML